MAVVSHLSFFLKNKFQGQARLIGVTPAPAWNYLFPDSPFHIGVCFYAGFQPETYLWALSESRRRSSCPANSS